LGVKDLMPLAVLGIVAYLALSGKGVSGLLSALSNAASSLPAKPFDPGMYTGPPATVNPLEGASTPQAIIAAQQAINSGSVGSVPRDTQLVFASHNRHWANQLGGEVRMTADQWNGYRARYVAAYGGENAPNLSMVIPGGAYLTAGEYLSKVNEARALIGQPSLGCLPGLGCAECGGTCGGGMEGWA
jgi:hypothetical protein